MASRVDAVVAGAGLAGTAVARVLGAFGFSVLVVEAGVDSARRLSGELIHASGVDDLDRLGLLEPLRRAGGTPISGFAVFSRPHWLSMQGATTKPAVGAGPAEFLTYGPTRDAKRCGLIVERASMMEALLHVLAETPRVELWIGARVTGFRAAADGPL